ncbi:GDP-D-glucose phosphorylase 1 [Culicoides brevitarsis]|uniref:GDP-D-glucose phosphorylase 1 n=1 Tax=Culicoides brevitarsis TaxID=469753 RepID=UPI00307BA45F
MRVIELDFKNDIDYQMIENFFRAEWEFKHESGVFNYKLNVQKDKILPGPHRFYVQLNPDRIAKRRGPEAIKSVTESFNPESFNFTKVADDEILLKIETKTFERVTLLINNSPLTEFHTLICPNLEKCLPQRLNLKGLEFAASLLMNFNDTSYRIGYNSPLALASVNHFHMHLLCIPSKTFYVETMKLVPLCEKREFYRTPDAETIKGFCFRITNSAEITPKCIDACKLVDYLCDHGIAHNALITYERVATAGVLRLFVWPREKPRMNKNLAPFNVGFCELAGYVTLGNEELFETHTEESISKFICDELGNGITEKMTTDLLEIFNKS